MLLVPFLSLLKKKFTHRYSLTASNIAPALIPFFLSGCGFNVAPSFPIVGAYFPSWMLCALIGVCSALCLRILFLLIGIDAWLSFRLFTYVSLGTIIALVFWLVVFGP